MGRRFLIAGLLVFALGTSATMVQVATFEQLTVATSSIGITTTVLDPAGKPQTQHCEAKLQTAQVRYRWDGTAPTSTVGTPLEAGDILTIDGNDVAKAIRFIRTGGTSGVLNIHCWT
mgnify:CR=1 FL=1